MAKTKFSKGKIMQMCNLSMFWRFFNLLISKGISKIKPTSNSVLETAFSDRLVGKCPVRLLTVTQNWFMYNTATNFFVAIFFPGRTFFPIDEMVHVCALCSY